MTTQPQSGAAMEPTQADKNAVQSITDCVRYKGITKGAILFRQHFASETAELRKALQGVQAVLKITADHVDRTNRRLGHNARISRILLLGWGMLAGRLLKRIQTRRKFKRRTRAKVIEIGYTAFKHVRLALPRVLRLRDSPRIRSRLLRTRRPTPPRQLHDRRAKRVDRSPQRVRVSV